MVQPDREGREDEDPDEGTIVDPRVIAERRARRAELAEDALHDRAIAAERQLAHAQQQLELAHDQRKDLAARLKQAERDLRGAQQGEYAEAQRRGEIEEDATAARRENERQLSSLRQALERAQAREQELEDELTRVRRAAQRTQQDSRTALVAAVQDSGSDDRAALKEAEAVLAERLVEADAVLAQRLEEVRLVEERLESGRRELASRRGGLELALLDSESVAGGLVQQLATERTGRVKAVRALEDERERAGAEVTLLQHELDRRARIQEAVARQLVELRAELECSQSRLTTDTERSKVSDSVMEELGSTALALRDELRKFEEQRSEVESQLADAQARIAERDHQLAESARRLADAESALQEIREQVDGAFAELRMTVADHAQQQVRLDAAELAMTTAEQRAREAADELEAERLQRAQVESDLHMTIAEERDAFRVTVEEHRSKTQAAIARERATFETQMTALQDNVTALRERLQEAAEAERDRLAEELRSRESLEADIKRSLDALTDELAEVRSESAGRAEREAQLEALVNELVGTAGLLKEGFELQIAAMTAEREARRQAETRIVELEDELEQARVALRPTPPMPPADHPALQDPGQAGGEGDADSVIIDLARAAARLRTPVEGAPEAGDSVDAGGATDDAEGEGDAPTETPEDKADDAEPGTPEERTDAGSRSTLPEVQIGRRADSAGPRAPSPWLATAITVLARRDAAAAAGLIQTLLPVQAARLRQDLAYDLAIAGHPELRVQLRADGTLTVTQSAATGAGGAVDASIAGSAESLAVLVAGGTKRRLPPGVSVTGKRRRARRLARAMRPPVGLSAVTAAGIELPVLLTLRLLADVIVVPVGPGQRFTVAFAEDAGPVQAHVVACDDAPLQVHEGAPVHAAATVRVGAGGLGAFLAGDAGARVQGDVAVVGRLLTWADAAQGLDIRRRP